MGYTTPEEQGRQEARTRVVNKLADIDHCIDYIQEDINLIAKGDYAIEYHDKIDEARKKVIKLQKISRQIKNLIE